MKECKQCEFFEGYDYSDGTPHCSYEENGKHGYEYCPFNDYTDVKKQGMKIEIDAGFMHDYILHTIQNTIQNEAYSVASAEIKAIITEELKDGILAEMNEQIKAIVSEEIKAFFEKTITIGGGWREPERVVTRKEYLSETIEKELGVRFKEDSVKIYAENAARKAIDDFTRKLKDEINEGVKTYFNQATRKILTENVVSMLMCNDTYQKLSNSMQKFLPTGEK